MGLLDPIWDAFNKTGLRDLKTKRYPVQCNYCNKDFDGRIDAMYIHIIDHFKDIPQPDRFKFIELQAKKTTASRIIKSKSVDNDDRVSEDTLSVLKKPKTSSNQSQTTINSYYTRPLTKDNINIIHEALVKFFITCGISFRIIESKYFRDFLALLNINYLPPSKYKLIRDLIPKIYSQILLKIIDSLKFCKDLTLIFDGWTTISNSSVYAFFAITSYGDIHMLGLEEFENQRHTSENIANIAIETINKIGLHMEQFSWIVTDSPNVMKKCRILSYSIAREVMIKNNKLISFFKTSHIWSKRLETWHQAQPDVNHGLATWTNIRWYSAYNNVKSIFLHESGFCQLLNHNEAKQSKTGLELDLDLCTLAIFCYPKTRKFAISKEKTLLDIQTTAINLIKKWNWNKQSALDIKNGLADYLNFIGDFNLDKGIPIDDPRIYWDHILNPKYAALVIFVKRILSLVPHAAETERCFSILGYNNTKYRNNMRTNTLKIIGQIKTWLRQNESSEIQIKNSKQDNEINSEEIYDIDDWDDNINDTLTSIELKDELETFFEEEQAELEDITNLTPKFIIEQLVDINDPIFYNQTALNNFIDESLVIDENNDSDWDINTIMDN
ncbi:9369_t:CDS:2, partial [Scutellospora calospora]